MSVIGQVEPQRLVTRSGGHPGDLLFVTGRLGVPLARHHLDFVPRVPEGRWLSAQGSVRAMMDLSDGLAADLPRLASASNCGFEIDPARLPRRRGCDAKQALGDGEDYELLLAVPPRLSQNSRPVGSAVFPRCALTEIGRLTKPGAGTQSLPPGFDHFFQLPAARRKSEQGSEDDSH